MHQIANRATGPKKRKEFTPLTKREAFKRSGGICESNLCNAPVTFKSAEYDHILPAAMGGDNSLSNCACICKHCHSVKTNGVVGDKAEIAKRRRQIKRQGQPKQTRAKIRSRGFDKTKTKGFDGQVRERARR